MVAGIALLFLAGIVDTTDEFVSLNKYIIIEDTISQTFVETVLYIGGALLFLVGFLYWLPVVSALRKAEQGLMGKIEECLRAEEALKKDSDELEMRVAQRTAELSRANEILNREIVQRKQLEAQLLESQKMEAIGRLASGVAHDFNNLLSAVLSFAQLGMRKVSSRHEGEGYFREISNAAERASHLTRQLLAFSRQQIIEPQIIDLNCLILSMDQMLRRLIGEDIELVMLPAQDLGMVRVDPAQLEWVVVNLAVNARDAMPDGGKLIVETADVTLDDEYARTRPEVTTGEYVMLAITDTGVGMSQKVKSHVFEPFFSTKEAGKGSGLGLSTCYGIVIQSGGYVRIDSELRRGTTVETYLPKVEGPAELLRKQNESASLPSGSDTVLVVEDEPRCDR